MGTETCKNSPSPPKRPFLPRITDDKSKRHMFDGCALRAVVWICSGFADSSRAYRKAPRKFINEYTLVAGLKRSTDASKYEKSLEAMIYSISQRCVYCGLAESQSTSFSPNPYSRVGTAKVLCSSL